jgi:hypothetical protein
MMANYFASLENIRSLYSIDKTLDRSYFSQFLTNAEIPDIKHLYTLKANESEVAKVLPDKITSMTDAAVYWTHCSPSRQKNFPQKTCDAITTIKTKSWNRI